MSWLNPSAHLSWKELACKDGTPYPEEFIKDGRCAQLVLSFECIRHLFGDQPITVLSAYRTPSWNAKVGGVKNSQHVQGRALDLRPPKGVTINDFFNRIRANTRSCGIKGIGKYKTFVHIDVRPADKLAIWAGSGVKI